MLKMSETSEKPLLQTSPSLGWAEENSVSPLQKAMQDDQDTTTRDPAVKNFLLGSHSVWKSSHRTGKRPGLDQTRTTQDRKSQDRTGPQPQSGPQSFAISKIPGLHKDWSGPVWTSLCGRYILLISANNILFTGT